MKFKKILVVYKDSILEKHHKRIDDVKSMFNKYDAKSVFLRKDKLNEECAEGYDLILSVGGDGTLLRVAHFVNSTAILGVNFDPKTSEGILCAAKSHDFKEKFARVIDSKFSVKRLTRARVFFVNSGDSYDALNEIYVGCAKPYHTSRYILKFGIVEEKQKSSGIIVATGTGSKAWYGSAVKQRFNPETQELRFIVREPYRGKLTKFNLTKGRLSVKQKLCIKSKMANGVVAVDSMIEKPLSNGEKVEISISPKPLKLISV